MFSRLHSPLDVRRRLIFALVFAPMAAAVIWQLRLCRIRESVLSLSEVGAADTRAGHPAAITPKAENIDPSRDLALAAQNGSRRDRTLST